MERRFEEEEEDFVGEGAGDPTPIDDISGPNDKTTFLLTTFGVV